MKGYFCSETPFCFSGSGQRLKEVQSKWIMKWLWTPEGVTMAIYLTRFYIFQILIIILLFVHWNWVDCINAYKKALVWSGLRWNTFKYSCGRLFVLYLFILLEIIMVENYNTLIIIGSALFNQCCYLTADVFQHELNFSALL